MFSDFLMKSKKSKTATSTNPAKHTSTKTSHHPTDDSGIVLIADDLEIDADKVLEERKAYLEEARSQDSGD